MPRKITTQPETRDDWQRLIPTLVANSADLPHLEAPRRQLEAILAETGTLLQQQAALAASRQEVSRRLQTLVAEGRQLAAFLRAGVKQKYGRRAEKLAEFNLLPFRGRKAAKPEEAARKKSAGTALPAGATPETAT
ncbi:MAG TPA: hypothetical protein DD490_10535 [Acidobacteria bacterium]|nr:hypothetical protein [Acidobacteriota bacterium]